MRYFLTLSALLLICTLSRAQNSTFLKSDIDAVTVYRDGAEVRRSAVLRLPPGRQTLILGEITAALVENSLQVTCPNKDVLILSVRHRHRYGGRTVDTADQNRINSTLEELLARERRLRTHIAIGEEEESVLQANRDLGGTATGLNAEDLERGVRYHRDRLAAIRLDRLALQDSLREIDETRKELGIQLNRSRADSLPDVFSEVVVELETTLPVTDSIFVSYLVRDAGWDPSYDLRVADLDQPLTLDFSARVRQRTGENWHEVKLTLSTGNPVRSATAPELQTWLLAPYRKPPVYDRSDPGLVTTEVGTVSGYVAADGLPLIGATVTVPSTSIGTVTDVDGFFTLSVPQGTKTLRVSYTGYEDRVVAINGRQLNIEMQEVSALLDEVVVVGYGRSNVLRQIKGKVQGGSGENGPPPVPTLVDRQPTTLNYLINTPFTVPSDTASRVVRIERHLVPAIFRHTAVPKVDERVFLSAVIRDWEAYDLISGELQLFVGGAFRATSRLAVEQTSDSLVVSLGADPGVVIRREPVERYSKQTGLFGGRRSVWRGWELSARNTKRVAVDLVVYDQVPVSADGSIDVEANLPEAATYDPETGLLEWRMVLPPRGDWRSEFAYEVRYTTHGPVYLE